MNDQPKDQGFYIALLLAVAFGVLGFVYDQLALVAVGVFYAVGYVLCLIYASRRRPATPPEIVEAYRKANRMQWWMLPPLFALGVGALFVARNDAYQEVIQQIVIPAIFVGVFFVVVIWPGILLFRAHKKTKARKQREAV